MLDGHIIGVPKFLYWSQRDKWITLIKKKRSLMLNFSPHKPVNNLMSTNNANTRMKNTAKVTRNNSYRKYNNNNSYMSRHNKMTIVTENNHILIKGNKLLTNPSTVD